MQSVSPLSNSLFGKPFLTSPAQDLLFQPEMMNDFLSLRLLERLFPTWVIVRFDSELHIQFISNNCASFFGYSPQQLKHIRFEDFLHHLHPQDKPAYLRLRQRMEELIQQLPAQELAQYRFVLNYRLRRGDGTYFHAHAERIFLPTEAGGYDSFILFRDMSEEKPFLQVQLEWYRLVKGIYRKVNNYVPLGVAHAVTQRETEILHLIKEGYSSKAIADKLSISLHTVRNHRSNLFKKMQAKNMVDLLNAVESRKMTTAGA